MEHFAPYLCSVCNTKRRMTTYPLRYQYSDYLWWTERTIEAINCYLDIHDKALIRRLGKKSADVTALGLCFNIDSKKAKCRDMSPDFHLTEMVKRIYFEKGRIIDFQGPRHVSELKMNGVTCCGLMLLKILEQNLSLLDKLLVLHLTAIDEPNLTIDFSANYEEMDSITFHGVRLYAVIPPNGSVKSIAIRNYHKANIDLNWMEAMFKHIHSPAVALESLELVEIQVGWLDLSNCTSMKSFCEVDCKFDAHRFTLPPTLQELKKKGSSLPLVTYAPLFTSLKSIVLIEFFDWSEAEKCLKQMCNLRSLRMSPYGVNGDWLVVDI
eukprot:GHVH01013896.1.p1 GENE.GHVH01013896.1~~GHVH01013896.1.p1  ORF type:complete len:324 (-),score=31.53 GHVH01013896.1:260-1231(-)